jgi:uncharacterized membrane protein YkvA (DUF1232 family)
VLWLGVSLLAVVALWLVGVGLLVLLGRPALARELLGFVANLAWLFRDLARRGDLSRSSKLLLAVTAAWIASPIDLIPEFIPVLGPLDDALVAALALRHVLRRIDESVLRATWRGEPSTVDLLLRFARR